MNLPKDAVRLSNKIQIWEIPNFASDEECKQLIEDAGKVGYQRSEVDSKDKSKTSSRTSTTSFLTQSQTKTGKQLGKKAQHIVGGESLEGIQVQKYLKGQKYNPHYDTFEKKDGNDQRSWTLMIYLNDVEKGGGTYFPKIDFRIYPKKGTAILWNNLDENYCRDNNTLHTGEPILEGEKYISTYWFRKPSTKNLCKQPNYLKFTMNPKAPSSAIETFTALDDTTKNCCYGGLILLGLLIIALIIYFSVYKNNKKKKRSSKVR